MSSEFKSLIEAPHGVAAAFLIAEQPLEFCAAFANFLLYGNARHAVELEEYGLRVILSGYRENRVMVRVSPGAEVEARA